MAMAPAVLFPLASCQEKDATSTTPTELETKLPHSLKGYELYSWQVENEWYFTLISGTNRLKSYEEVTSGGNVVEAGDWGWVNIRVKGVDSIKATLGRLPEGEQVLWVGEHWQKDWGNIALPPNEPVDEIEAYCRQLGVELNVVV